MTKCLTLFRTFPSHIVRKISSASAQGISYSNSVRTIPILRLFRAMVALSSAMRTLALLPLLLAINPSRIFECRTMYFFHPSCATRNLRSISTGMAAIVRTGARHRDRVEQSSACALLLGCEILRLECAECGAGPANLVQLAEAA